MNERIARTVGALIVSSEGLVLLGLRARWKPVWPSHWDTIGGRVEPGESLDDALVREVFEEVGVRPTVFRQITSVPERRPELYGPALHHIYAVIGWAGGEPFNASDEHSELRWFSVQEISLLQKIVDCDYGRYAQLAVNERHGSL